MQVSIKCELPAKRGYSTGVAHLPPRRLYIPGTGQVISDNQNPSDKVFSTEEIIVGTFKETISDPFMEYGVLPVFDPSGVRVFILLSIILILRAQPFSSAEQTPVESCFQARNGASPGCNLAAKHPPSPGYQLPTETSSHSDILA